MQAVIDTTGTQAVGTQKQSGKAFEYATLKSLQSCLGRNYCQITDSSCMRTAEADFASLEPQRQTDCLAAGGAAARQLLRFEPHLHLAVAGKHEISLSLQPDHTGATGDVRDVVIAIPERQWEIGISAKHHHEALKHSRLSRKINFGQDWFGVSCTPAYFAKIAPIFDQLEESKRQGLKWAELPDKKANIYSPLLSAFKDELLTLDQANPGVVAPALVSYLIGHKDFYKVVKLKGKTKVQVFNFNGSLNTPADGQQPEVRLNKLKLPSRIVELRFASDKNGTSKTTVNMICDAGWTLSFRMHNARSLVEPSLKFDINLVGHPNNLECYSSGWY